MNSLIQQLAEKAKNSVPHGLSPDKWIETYNEKFAELIVRECVETLGTHEDYWTHEQSMDLLKKHFGVDE